MKFQSTAIVGAVVVVPEIHRDDRGSFTRLRCTEEFSQAGIPSEFVQSNLSITQGKGVLRGMHFQRAPSTEGKLVRCVSGAVHDVIIDLRPGSESYLKHVCVDLIAQDCNALFVPSGCAHGFMTLARECHVLYEMTDYYQPELASGVRWNDPAFGINWPMTTPTGHERDLGYPDFDPSVVAGFPAP